MCFYHDDFDWIARVHETDTRKSNGKVKCLECFQVIPLGETYTHIEMREHEECQRCQDECSEEYQEGHPECADGKHDFGEEDEHRICRQCEKLLEAIQRVEEDDGCSGSETRPAYGQLREAFWESDHAVEYIDRARKDSPELAMSGYLDRFYQLTGEWETRLETWDTRDWDGDDVGPTEELGGEG